MRTMLLLLVCSLAFGGSSFANRAPQADAPMEIEPAGCESNVMVLDVLAQRTPLDKLIIVVARTGEYERRVNISRRRLHNVRTYLTEFLTHPSVRREAGTVVLAEGESVKGDGRLEFYIDGRLAATLKVKRDADLSLGTCVPDDPQRGVCDMESDKNFYPCRDRRARKGRVR